MMSFRGYRTTAPLKLLSPAGRTATSISFPWLPNHGSIEARRQITAGRVGWLVSVVTEPRLH